MSGSLSGRGLENDENVQLSMLLLKNDFDLNIRVRDYNWIIFSTDKIRDNSCVVLNALNQTYLADLALWLPKNGSSAFLGVRYIDLLLL
jgi:hypothetical protein